MSGWTNRSTYRGKPLSEIFEVDYNELLRSLKISLGDLLEDEKFNKL